MERYTPIYEKSCDCSKCEKQECERRDAEYMGEEVDENILDEGTDDDAKKRCQAKGLQYHDRTGTCHKPCDSGKIFDPEARKCIR